MLSPPPPSGSNTYPLGSSCQTDSTGAQVGVDGCLSFLARSDMQHIDGTALLGHECMDCDDQEFDFCTVAGFPEKSEITWKQKSEINWK